MEKGISYADFPDVCVVYISAFDIFKLNQPMYHVCRVVKGTEQFVENGTHEIYVNAAVDDGSAIAELMQYFVNSSGYHENFKAVCKRVDYLKEQNKGVSSMSAIIEEYAKRYHEEQMQNSNVIEQYAKRYHEEQTRENDKEKVIRLLKKGISIEIIAETFPSLSQDAIQKLKDELELHAAV